MSAQKPAHAAPLVYKPEEYAYSVQWSEEDQAYIGRVAEFPSLAADGASPEAALQEITDLVRFGIELLAESGDELPAPLSKRSFSGKLNLRMPAYLHRHLALEAAQQHVSLNQWINLKLSLPLAL